jgi:hypothetical protein
VLDFGTCGPVKQQVGLRGMPEAIQHESGTMMRCPIEISSIFVEKQNHFLTLSQPGFGLPRCFRCSNDRASRPPLSLLTQKKPADYVQD